MKAQGHEYGIHKDFSRKNAIQVLPFCCPRIRKEESFLLGLERGVKNLIIQK